MAELNGNTPKNSTSRKRGRPRASTPAKKRKIQAKLKTRVVLGDTFVEWRELKDRLELKSDRELARRLLDSFQATTSPSPTCTDAPRSSSPQTWSQPPTFDAGDVSSVDGHSESEGLGHVENSISNLSVCDLEDEAEINALENTRLSVDMDCEDWSEEEEDAYEYIDDVEKDPDYVPSVKMRYKRRFQKKSERWSIYVPREPKKYLYIKDLQAEIVDKRVDSNKGMSTKQPMSETDPRRLGSLAKIPPVPTNVLVQQHRSRTDLTTQGSLTS